VKPRDANPATAEERVRQVELLISNLLRTGVTASLVIVVLGTVLSFVHHPQYVSSPAELQRLTRPGAAFPRSLGDVWAGVRDLSGQAIVVVGLLLLIATPVMRVAVSIFAFMYEGDRTYVLITSVVLALLMLSFALGRGGG